MTKPTQFFSNRESAVNLTAGEALTAFRVCSQANDLQVQYELTGNDAFKKALDKLAPLVAKAKTVMAHPQYHELLAQDKKASRASRSIDY